MSKFKYDKRKLEIMENNNKKLNILFNSPQNNPLKGFFIPVNSELLDAFEYSILILNECAAGLRLIGDFKNTIIDLNDLILDHIDLIEKNEDIEEWINYRLNILFGISRKQNPPQLFLAAKTETTTKSIIKIFDIMEIFALGHLNLNEFNNKINELIEIYEDCQLDLFGDDNLIEEVEDEAPDWTLKIDL